MRVSKRTIEDLPLPETGYHIHWDDTLPGFGVRVTSFGVKAFVFQRRVNGKERRITLGRCTDITPEQARRMAIQAAGEIVKGVDPVHEKRRKQTEGVTLNEAFEDYLIARDLKDLTIHDMRMAMKNVSDWLDKPIKSITRDMVIQRHRDHGKRSKARANVTMRYLRAILNHAMAVTGTPMVSQS